MFAGLLLSRQFHEGSCVPFRPKQDRVRCRQRGRTHSGDVHRNVLGDAVVATGNLQQNTSDGTAVMRVATASAFETGHATNFELLANSVEQVSALLSTVMPDLLGDG